MADSTPLGEFLRAGREALKPHDVGLPGHGRRRVPGLRREELAVVDLEIEFSAFTGQRGAAPTADRLPDRAHGFRGFLGPRPAPPVLSGLLPRAGSAPHP